MLLDSALILLLAILLKKTLSGGLTHRGICTALPSTSENRSRPRRVKVCGTSAVPKSIGTSSLADNFKAYVFKHMAKLVETGHAEWSPRTNGDVELRLATGEVYLLASSTVTRIE
jgi:hypothetical protein